MTLRDPALRARVLSAETGADFPWKPAPSLSGPLRGLAFGMSADEARKAAPAFAPAFEDYAVSAASPVKWLPLGNGTARVRIYKRGLDMIEVRFPDAAAATKALEAAWGPAKVGVSGFSWHGWFNREHGIRAVLMKGDGDALDRLELLPYRPLDELMADGGELSWNGKHLLDCTLDELAEALAVKSGEDVQMLPIELSSGHIPLRVAAKDGRVVRYTIGIDYTYDAPISATVQAALQKHFGVGTKEPPAPYSKKECTRFPATVANVAARACVYYKQWQITLGPAGDDLSVE